LKRKKIEKKEQKKLLQEEIQKQENEASNDPEINFFK